ncbi:MAG: zinc-ribbon domain-containing protein [Ruminococcus sp.]|nr:zinc-ribbon domain-containing protein [Ruminococcus sp.]MDD5889966.1 zinc-ribbon domain-containing protein [Ruminococcus sp.]
MICKNCGFQNPDGAKFCASCGQKIEMSNPVQQNNVPDNNTQQNNIPQNNAQQNNVPQNNAQQNSVTKNNNQHNSVHRNNVPQGAFVHQGNVKQNNAPQNNIPNNYNPQGNVPQGNIPNNYNPQNTMPNNIPQGNVPNNIPNNYNPQNGMPQNNMPQGNFQPQNGMPQNGMPQFNNFPNQGGSQTVIDPVTGQPIKNKNSKKVLPLILGIAGGVVAVIVAVVIVFSVIDNSGIDGVLNNLEDGINDKDINSIKKCVPEFMVKDMDVSQSDIDDMFGVSDKYSFEIDFDVKSEEDVTDSNCSEANNYTWKEYIQDRYENYDGYDGGEVQEVTKAKIKYDIDFDNDTANAIAGLASLGEDSLTKDFYFVKYDGSWYLFEM